MHKASARTCTNKEQSPALAVLQSPEIHVSPMGCTGRSLGIAVSGRKIQPRCTQQWPEEPDPQRRQAVPVISNITKKTFLETILETILEFFYTNEHLSGSIIGKCKGRRQGAMELIT